MGQNLKSYIEERRCMTAKDVVRNLSEQVPGRSIGEFYVVESWVNDQGNLEMELDDGCRFTFKCSKSK